MLRAYSAPQYLGDKLMSATKYFSPSFETKHVFLALSIAEELKKV